jgi:tetratricopeptide (TPR) repeat protein
MKTFILSACVVCLLMTFGCGGDGGGGPSDTAASLTAAGWALFEQGEYEAAITKFNQALGLDVTYADAYNGLGWSNAKLDSLTESLLSFGMCISYDNTMVDPYAGCTPVYRDYEFPTTTFAEDTTANFDSALVFAQEALSRDADYEFSHDETFNWEDIHLIMAQSYFGKGEFLSALAQVQLLGYQGTLDPESSTWPQELAEAIEQLETEIGG